MSETIKRIISGFSIALIYGLFFQVEFLYFFPLYIFICAVTVIVLTELYSMFLDDPSDNFNKRVGIVFGVILVTNFYLRSLDSYRTHTVIDLDWLNRLLDFVHNQTIGIYAIFIVMFMILGVYNILTARLKGAISSLAIIFFGIIYIPLTISFIFTLRTLPSGVFYIWLVSYITVLTDVWGYTVGKLFGRHKLPLPVSPNKTWEGYIGAFILQLLCTVAFYIGVGKFFTVPDFSILEIIFISVLIYGTAVFGDLFESLVKRNADHKDSGDLLPGHGGLLDRVDSIMFSLPVFYFYLLLKG